jgi:hypothetical protein
MTHVGDVVFRHVCAHKAHTRAPRLRASAQGGDGGVVGVDMPPKLVPQGNRFFAVDSRGTVRRTICIGPWALKVARNATGRCCNRFEADLWVRTTAARRNMLCPVLARLPFGLAVIMQRARPLSEDEAERLRNTRGFPDWDYVPPDDECPFEFKASDWGRLPDGRLVALDYSMPALD